MRRNILNCRLEIHVCTFLFNKNVNKAIFLIALTWVLSSEDVAFPGRRPGFEPEGYVAVRKACATLKDMQTQRAYYFYFWFSPPAAER